MDSETRITLRLPTELRDRLQAASNDSERSMNGEIVFRLDDFDRLAEEVSTLKENLARVEEANLRSQLELRHAIIEGETQRAATKEMREALIASHDEMTRKEHQLRKLTDEYSALEATAGALRIEIQAMAQRLAAAQENPPGMKMALIFDKILMDAAHGNDEVLQKTLEAYRNPPSMEEIEAKLRLARARRSENPIE